MIYDDDHYDLFICLFVLLITIRFINENVNLCLLIEHNNNNIILTQNSHQVTKSFVLRDNFDIASSILSSS